MEDLVQLINAALEEAKADRKKCWREDVEEKAFHDGEVRAFNYCLQMIKKIYTETN